MENELKKILTPDEIKMEKVPLSLEQVGNYIHHKDFDIASRKKIQALKDRPLAPEANPAAQMRLLRVALACLPKKDKGLVYRKLLACRIQGATHEDIARSMKISVVKVKELEYEAISTVKSILSSRRVMPVVQ